MGGRAFPRTALDATHAAYYLLSEMGLDSVLGSQCWALLKGRAKGPFSVALRAARTVRRCLQPLSQILLGWLPGSRFPRRRPACRNCCHCLCSLPLHSRAKGMVRLRVGFRSQTRQPSESSTATCSPHQRRWSLTQCAQLGGGTHCHWILVCASIEGWTRDWMI